jgi:hypothetical protein
MIQVTRTAAPKKKCTCGCQRCNSGNYCGNYGSGCQHFYGRSASRNYVTFGCCDAAAVMVRSSRRS